MIKMMAAIRRKPGMTQQEFFRYIREVHGAIAQAEPITVRRYVQNHVFDSAFGAEGDPEYQQIFHRDSVTELWFDDFESMGQTFSHPYTREKVGPDGANFSDLGTALAVLTREVEEPVPQAGDNAPVKILYFMRKRDEVSLADYFERWAAAHTQAMSEQTPFAAALRRCVRSLQLPKGNPALVYFGGKGMPIYEGVCSLWFDDEGALAAFRTYQAAVEACNREQPFFEPGQSFFLMAREIQIMPADPAERFLHNAG